MKGVTLNDAFLAACLCSCVLFLTGLSTIPFAVKHDAVTQNFIYFIGRIPVIFAAILIYFNVGKRDE